MMHKMSINYINRLIDITDLCLYYSISSDKDESVKAFSLLLFRDIAIKYDIKHFGYSIEKLKGLLGMYRSQRLKELAEYVYTKCDSLYRSIKPSD